MKKINAILLLLLLSVPTFAQNNHIMVAAGGDCLYAYNVQYDALNKQFKDDMDACLMGLIMDWVELDAMSASMNSDCAMEGLRRYYTNIDNAAAAFTACSGVVIVD